MLADAETQHPMGASWLAETLSLINDRHLAPRHGRRANLTNPAHFDVPAISTNTRVTIWVILIRNPARGVLLLL